MKDYGESDRHKLTEELNFGFHGFLSTTEKSLVSISAADERFQAEQEIGFPLEPAVQR